MRSIRSTLLLLSLAAALTACGGGGGSNASSAGGGTTATPSSGQLTITTASILPATVQGHSYSASLAASNGQGALHWSITQTPGLFVNGLTIDPNTGALSGTVNWAGTAGFNATVTDSASHTATEVFTITAYSQLTSTQNQTITVTEFQPPINIGSGITGGLPPLAFSVTSGTIAPGLRFGSTGQLTGGAYALGTYQFTVTAQDSFSPPDTATQTITLIVKPPPLSAASTIPFPALLSLNRPFSGRVIGLGGIPPYFFSLSNSAALPSGLSFDASTGILSGTPTVNNSGFGGAVSVSDSSSPPQKTSAPINFSVLPPLGRNDSPATATQIDNGFLSASISPYIDPPNGVPAVGDNDYYKLVSVGGATVHVETFAKRNNPNNPLDTVIEIVDGNGVRLSTCRQPGNTTTTFAGSCINDDISLSPHVQDSAIDFLVPGTNSTSTSFYVHVFDWRGDGRPDMIYSLQVSGVIDPLVIAAPAAATRGAAYSQQLIATHANGAVSWSITGGSLPPGLTLANAVISGTATTDGSYSFTLQASDAGPPAQVATAQETIVVGEPVKITSSGTFPPACVNQPYSFQMTASGGTPPFSWGFVSSGVWAGVNLAYPTGIFSGTPTVTGTFLGRTSVNDAAQSGDSQQISLTVQQCP